MQTITSPNRYKGRNRAVRMVVVHTMETDETGSIAENVANYFAKSSTRASAHICTDNNSDVRCVADSDTAWAAPGANADAYQHEYAGRAAQTASGWKDTYSVAMLRRGAKIDATWAVKDSIPVRRLSVAQVRDGKSKGFAGHWDVTRAFGKSSHTDPGDSFPWTFYLGLVQAEVHRLVGGGGASKPTGGTSSSGGSTSSGKKRKPTKIRTLRRGDEGNYVAMWQELLRWQGYDIAHDGSFGGNTEAATKKWQAKVDAQADGVVGPESWVTTLGADASGSLARGDKNVAVGILQHVVGVDADRSFGAATETAAEEVQRYLGVDDDGRFGPSSRRALYAWWV